MEFEVEVPEWADAADDDFGFDLAGEVDDEVPPGADLDGCVRGGEALDEGAAGFGGDGVVLPGVIGYDDIQAVEDTEGALDDVDVPERRWVKRAGEYCGLHSRV